jgi:hypothetical protein
MKQKIKGIRYDYEIDFSKTEFQIFAICKEDNRQSSITNLNTIVGEIVEPILKTNEIENSWVEVDLKKGEKLFSLAIITFTDKHWIEYLEKNLNEDKQQGGWNTKYKFQ